MEGRGRAVKKYSSSLLSQQRSCLRSSNPFEYLPITIIHSISLAQPLAIQHSVPSASIGVVLGLLITGVPLGLMTFLVALTRIVVRVLYLVVLEIRQDSATLTEAIPTPQSCTR
jgi:hypothetical protein